MKYRTLAAAKKAAKKAVKKTTTVKKAAKKTAPTQAAKTSVPKKAAAKKAPVASKAAEQTTPKQAAPKQAAPKTTIVAHADIGFGNTLYLRGDGPGLSWSKGVPMDCNSNSTWTISFAGIKQPFEFKVILNDTYWSAGYNQAAAAGAETVVYPSF